MGKKVSAAVLMPSGKGRTTEDHEFKIIYDGRALERTRVCPELMVNPELLRRRWSAASDSASQVEGSIRAAAFRL